MDWSDLQQAEGRVVGKRFRLEKVSSQTQCRALRLDDRQSACFHRLRREHTTIDFGQPPAERLHPSMVEIWDQGLLDDAWAYVITPVIEAQNLDDLLEQGPVAPGRTLRLLQGMATVLQAVHAYGWVLRDLRTPDVWIGSSWQADDQIYLPAHPDLLGKAAGRSVGGYCAPETDSMNAMEVDARADQYCLGIIAFELLTGTTPHNPDAPPGERTQTPVLPHPDVPTVLEPLLTKLLAPLPERRFPDDYALLTALHQAATALEPSGAYGQFTPVILPMRSALPFSPVPYKPVETLKVNGPNHLPIILLLFIVFITMLTTSTMAVFLLR